MNAKKLTLTSGTATAAWPGGAERRIASVSLLLSLSAGILVFGPSWRTAHSSAPNPLAAPAASAGAVPLQVTGGNAVKLAQPLGTPGSAIPLGSVIPLGRVTGDFFVSTAPDCASRHLHANPGPVGITICNKGPFLDPDPNGCGYGQVVPFATDIGITLLLIYEARLTVKHNEGHTPTHAAQVRHSSFDS